MRDDDNTSNNYPLNNNYQNSEKNDDFEILKISYIDENNQRKYCKFTI